MLKGTLILVLAYVAAVSCAIIPQVDPKDDSEAWGDRGCETLLIIDC